MTRKELVDEMALQNYVSPSYCKDDDTVVVTIEEVKGGEIRYYDIGRVTTEIGTIFLNIVEQHKF